MKFVVLISILSMSLWPKLFFNDFQNHKWKMVTSKSTLSPKEHLVKEEYCLTFIKHKWIIDFRLEKGCNNEGKTLKYFDDYTDWYFVRRKKIGKNSFKISTAISNKDKMMYYKILKDTNLVNLKHHVFFQQSHGTMKIQNDTLIINLIQSSDSPDDWLTWKFVKQ